MSYDNDVIIMCLCKHFNDYYTGKHSTSQSSIWGSHWWCDPPSEKWSKRQYEE